MLEVTEKAGSVIKDFLEKQQGPRAVRILLQDG
jgi:Fe-S cluster assembly iron-binding protein IscA